MLILASASPRRADLLRQAGIRFEVYPAQIPEERLEAEPPSAYVLRLAREKAAAVSHHHPGRLCLAADTVVVLHGRVLEKPDDAAHAERMLRDLSGKPHTVLTAFCLRDGEATHLEAVETRVTFRELTDTDIHDYVATGDPLDKAGGYGIQSGAAHMVRRIEGSYTNVVGLPMAEVMERLRAFPQASSDCGRRAGTDR